mmetsp:Transcript_308/g.368  ORF Transcript_308/g.368 Transcript_308/m.368 type:complete len:322 (-) Transcript_308:562-1527(-)|eukprot:CAMPEP_0119035536 /NCGR_PEP_ID=MMETSP1177-20130426/2590_1 /TAXON_ID=2985 /ORGANISM="Ochromonas sp, Strain CCMP1899" /LENGTH=321 /DNA_ID=CAMNT_0006993915 /DNA_START=44 /DNA_END=1009 /DNA_ORIENTATION=-
MSNKRGAEKVGGNEDDGKRMKSLADSVDIQAVMASEGPIVLVVILRTNGEMEEKSIDMTPKKDLVKQEIGGHPITFLGQWQMLDVVIVINAEQDSENLPTNTHKLHTPFNDAEVKGDMLLMRSDDSGEPVDFTLDEYKEFQALTHKEVEDWKPEDEGDDEDQIGDDDEDDDDEDDDDEDPTEAEQELFDTIVSDMTADFIKEHSREPTEAENAEILQECARVIDEMKEGGDDEADFQEQFEVIRENVVQQLIENFVGEHTRQPSEAEMVVINEQSVVYTNKVIEEGAGDDEDEDSNDEGEDEEGEGDEDDDEPQEEGEDAN